MASFFANTLAEMQRRRVIRVATAYALVSWVLLQLGEITFEPLQLPGWALTALIFTLLLGFPLVMAAAWIFDWTGDGVERTAANSHSTRARAATLLLAVLVLDGAFGYYLYTIYAPSVRGAGDVAPQTLLSADAPPVNPYPANSIAVLPFVDLSAAADQQYFSHGISEEILNVLAKVDGLQVAARTSSFAFAGQARDVKEIGSLLNVATVLEGSIRRAGDSVRVTAQLVDTSSGFSLWSNTFDRELDLILAIQDEIARAIADELLGSYDGLAMRSPIEGAPSSFEAYDLYLQGRELWRSREPDALSEATRVFQRIIDLDPSFAPAYSGLADTYLLLSSYGNMSNTEALQRAEPLIQTALELDGQLSEGFASLGLLYMNLGRSRAAEAHLRRAISLDRENTAAQMWLGSLAGQQGRLAEQQLILEEALRDDPLNPLLNINLAGNESARGQRTEADARMQDMLRIYPTSTMVLRTAAEFEARDGDFDTAFEYAARALEIAPEEPTNQAVFTQLLLSLGAIGHAQPKLEDALELGPDNGFVVKTNLRYLTMSGRLDQARAAAEARLESLGETAAATLESLIPHWWLARLDLLEGHASAAAEHYDFIVSRADALPPLYTADVLTWAAAAELYQQDQEQSQTLLVRAERLLREARLQGLTGTDLLYIDACIAALSGDAETALSKLAQARSSGWLQPWELEHDARLAGLYPRPEFQSMIEELQQTSAEMLQTIDAEILAEAATHLLQPLPRGQQSLAATNQLSVR